MAEQKLDIVNKRVNIAQMEFQKRADRLEKIVKSAATHKKISQGFKTGTDLVANMIAEHSKLYDVLVFDTPQTALEQHRNLMLTTGTMNQTVQQGIKPATDAIDMMLDTLEQMSR